MRFEVPYICSSRPPTTASRMSGMRLRCAWLKRGRPDEMNASSKFDGNSWWKSVYVAIALVGDGPAAPVECSSRSPYWRIHPRSSADSEA